MKILENLRGFIKDNKISFILFLTATLFFIFQHYHHLAWDFSAYVLNAEYLFHGGGYFEVYRAPLISFILGPLLVFGKFAEYLFIILISGFFFYSVLSLSDVLYMKYFYKYNIEKEFLRMLFVFFCFNPFVLMHGLLNGTELLAVSFFILFLVDFIKNNYSGHWLALAVLSRYNFLIFLPFLLFNKDWKKILKNMGLFVAVIFPWLLFNFIKYGNWFASILDSYYLNILSRESMTQPFQLSQLFPVFNWFIIFFVLGLATVVWKISKKHSLKSFKYEILFFIIGFFLFYDFYTTPFKIIRYTFNFFLPIAFFCVLGVSFLINKLKTKKNIKKILLIVLIVGFVLSLGFLINEEYGNYDNSIFFDVQKDIKNLGLGKCTVYSPHWVPLNYYHENSYLLTSGIGNAVSSKSLVVIFKNIETMDDYFNRENFDDYNVLLERNSYLIFGRENLTEENCNLWRGYDYPIKEDPCDVVTEKFEESSLEKPATDLCELINTS